MNILLAGTPETTVMVADAIKTAGHTIAGVLCPFPKPIGRKQIVTPCDLETWAKKQHIPVLNVDKDLLKMGVDGLNLPPCDVLVVADFGYLVPSWLLAWPTEGAYNIHPSLLPRWRGATPVPFTILFGDKETGVTVIKMNEKFDMGSIVAQQKVEVLESDTTPTLLHRCFDRGSQMIVNILADLTAGKVIKEAPQVLETQTPPTRKFTKDDGHVPRESLVSILSNFTSVGPIPLLDQYDLPKNLKSLRNMCQALLPWPKMWTRTKEEKRVLILRVDDKTIEYHLEGAPLSQSAPFTSFVRDIL
ncbi:MAG TPA: methionyl-tRNA formyltransferase [Patescibacteria group bacterium]|nr:methionyl-tRNA formyltransferase [Patescibacteria group bacterium]